MLRVHASLATAAALAVGLVLALVPCTSAAQAPCRPTPTDAAGPFERLDAPRRAKIGTGHVLQGRVVRAGDCNPVSRALVFFWQSGPNGYTARGRGSVLTDRAGRFRIEGPVPFNYGRGPHIHLAVIHPAYEELVTRYVVRRGATTGRIRLVLVPLL
jgi:protocatechuate 3,4-dioxygenase beta subunit